MYFKQFFFAALFVLISFNVASCNKSDENEGNTNLTQNIAANAMNNSESAQSNLVEAAPSASVYVIKNVKGTASGKAPEFTWMEGDKEVSFAELTKGKVVFLNFWGTWCPPCRAELPDIVQIGKDLSDKDFIIIGIPLERVSDPVAQVKKFSEARGIEYRNIIDANQQLASAYGGITGVPTTIIIDKKGNISETLVGARSKSQFMVSINRVLN